MLAPTRPYRDRQKLARFLQAGMQSLSSHQRRRGETARAMRRERQAALRKNSTLPRLRTRSTQRAAASQPVHALQAAQAGQDSCPQDRLRHAIPIGRDSALDG
jgi:hypothetical protein